MHGQQHIKIFRFSFTLLFHIVPSKFRRFSYRQTSFSSPLSISRALCYCQACHNCFHFATVFNFVDAHNFLSALETVDCLSAQGHGYVVRCSKVLYSQSYMQSISDILITERRSLLHNTSMSILFICSWFYYEYKPNFLLCVSRFTSTLSHFERIYLRI